MSWHESLVGTKSGGRRWEERLLRTVSEDETKITLVSPHELLVKRKNKNYRVGAQEC